MKNIDLMMFSTIASFLYELYIIYINYRKPLEERLKFQNVFIEYFPLILYPTISFFLSYVLWYNDNCVETNNVDKILAINIGFSSCIFIEKPLKLIS